MLQYGPAATALRAANDFVVGRSRFFAQENITSTASLKTEERLVAFSDFRRWLAQRQLPGIRSRSDLRCQKLEETLMHGVVECLRVV